jgi:flagellar secretion chaperone FliS
MHEAPSDVYLRTRVMTSSPAELRLLLLDGAIRFAEDGREGLVEGDQELLYAGFSQCRNILLELVSSVREEVDPVLSQRVRGLYTYMFRRLVEARLDENVEAVDEVIELLRYERETWVMLMGQLNGGAGSEPGAHPSAPSSEHATGYGGGSAPTSTISVSG